MRLLFDCDCDCDSTLLYFDVSMLYFLLSFVLGLRYGKLLSMLRCSTFFYVRDCCNATAHGACWECVFRCNAGIGYATASRSLLLVANLFEVNNGLAAVTPANPYVLYSSLLYFHGSMLRCCDDSMLRRFDASMIR